MSYVNHVMDKPIEPSKEDCCNSGCNPCIFDIYEKQLKLYEKYLENGKILNDVPRENGIPQLEYTKFIVVKNETICESHNHILLKRTTMDRRKVWWKPGDHFLFKYNSNELSCTRAYTPIKLNNEPESDYDFSIFVKKYDGGVVSTHLFNLQEGCVTLWRGPYGHYEITPNRFDRIIMIAQGTGVAPFISIIDNILNNEDDMTKIILLYCCKCIDTILFRDKLCDYKSYWNFTYEIYLRFISTDAKIKYQEPIQNKKLCLEEMHNLLQPFCSKDQVLICGSQTFNECYNIHLRKVHPVIENIVLF